MHYINYLLTYFLAERASYTVFRTGSSSDQQLPTERVTASGEDTTEWSCIGVRQRCLKDVAGCSDALAAYRTHCREDKKLDQCVASDW